VARAGSGAGFQTFEGIMIFTTRSLTAGASLLALAGLADFDATTGAFDLRPFNLYEASGALAGLLSSALAGLAAVKGWGRK
jgi:hypothetical protein